MSTKMSAKTPAEYHEKVVERNEHDDMLKEKIRVVLDEIDAANMANVLQGHIDRGWVKKQVIKTRYFTNHTNRQGAIPEVYDIFCASPLSCRFIIDFLTVHPPSNQIAQQYVQLLKDRLTYVERVQA